MGHLGTAISLETNVSGKKISSPKISSNADHKAHWLSRSVSAVVDVACKIVKAVAYFIKSLASFLIEAFVTGCKYIYQCLTSPFASTQTGAVSTNSGNTEKPRKMPASDRFDAVLVPQRVPKNKPPTTPVNSATQTYADITQSAPTVTAFNTDDEFIRQFPHYTFNNLLDALKALDCMKEQGNEAQGYELTGKLYTCKERAFAEVKLSNGYKCFMYRSSGKGSGHESQGEWVPFPGWYMGPSITGVAPRGWVIKGDKANKLDKYKVPVFQRVANDLKAREKQLFPDFKYL